MAAFIYFIVVSSALRSRRLENPVRDAVPIQELKAENTGAGRQIQTIKILLT
jgi:hypothetical protein